MYFSNTKISIEDVLPPEGPDISGTDLMVQNRRTPVHSDLGIMETMQEIQQDGGIPETELPAHFSVITYIFLIKRVSKDISTTLITLIKCLI